MTLKLKMKEDNKIFKVGVIDDHVQTAISLSQVLEYNGFKTFQAYNVKNAIDLTKKEKPDLILLDIRLDQESGYDVAKALPNQKILFITGYEPDRGPLSKFKNSVGVMTKPVNIDELVKNVRKALKIPELKDKKQV